VFDAMRHQVPSGITADDAGIIVAWGGPGFSGHWTKKELSTSRKAALRRYRSRFGSPVSTEVASITASTVERAGSSSTSVTRPDVSRKWPSTSAIERLRTENATCVAAGSSSHVEARTLGQKAAAASGMTRSVWRGRAALMAGI
jgi:hypothetical protein